MKKALVLAGGGARGSYHIGAWQALTEMGFRPDIVTGTSVGSLNGVLVALDWFDIARGMWLSIEDRDVMDIPEKVVSKETLAFAKDFATKGGISLEPLEKMITRFVDEEQLRNSPCRYGLVTVNINTRKPMELTLEEIPQGKLVDYMIASSACFPFLRPKAIDGQTYIDGGYYDNLPTNLAARMGAQEIVEVDLDSLGINRRLEDEYKDVKVTVVKSWHDLGSFLDFNPENARRNMEIGYLDTYKAFGKLEGKAYAFKKGETEKMYENFGAELMKNCGHLCEKHPGVRIASEVYMHVERKNPKTETDKFLAVLEGAMAAGNLPLGEVYTAENLPEYILAAKPGGVFEKIEQFAAEKNITELLSPLGAADVKKLYLHLLKDIL